MSQEWVFTYLPYLALGICLAGCSWRLLASGRPQAPDGEGSVAARIFGRSRAWIVGIAVTLAAHVVGLLLPAQLLAWNQHSLRLLVLETTGLAFGCLALAGLASNLLAWRRSFLPTPEGAAGETPERRLSKVDVVVLTLVVAVLVSGLAVALLHRWGSSWAAVTVVPWAYSVLRLDPEPLRMTGLPYLARIHVIGVFVLLAVWPYSTFGAFITRVRDVRRTALARSS